MHGQQNIKKKVYSCLILQFMYLYCCVYVYLLHVYVFYCYVCVVFCFIVLFYILFVCKCVLYCIAATGCQPNCS